MTSPAYRAYKNVESIFFFFILRNLYISLSNTWYVWGIKRKHDAADMDASVTDRMGAT